MDERQDRRSFWINVRMGIIVSIILAMLSAVVARVYYLQTVQGADLHEKAHDQSSREIKLKAKRGSILDRNGVELAVSVEAPSIAVRPQRIKDHPEAARKLAEHLDLSEDEILARLGSSARFVWLARQINPADGEAIAALDLDGVEIHVESKRFYPMQARAGQLLGFTNIDGVGLEGLERTFDDELAGGEFRIKGVRDARGRTLLTNATPEFEQFEGNSLLLTIDERIQRVTEQALAEQVEKYNAKGGYAVVIDPNTGDVLALANTPSFDPNRFKEAQPGSWRLRSITDTFEPGSTFKPIVLAAALQEQTTTLHSRFDCEGGRIRIGRYTIRDSHPSEILTAAQIIQESSNIGIYKIAQTLGKERFYRYIRAFGFGRSTGLGIPGEQPGLVWPPDRWAEVSFANIAFGQGITSTPLQVATAVGAIANGGMMMQPRIVDRIINKDGEIVRKTHPTLVRRVVSPEVARQVAWSMALVTVEGGTGKKAALEHYTVAGKTGTAQKVNPETRRYDPNMWVGSFVGFAPAEKPDVVALVMIDEPRGVHYGGVVAAPAFKKIVTEALSVRGVLPIPEEERFRLTEEEEEVSEAEQVVRPTEDIELETVPVEVERLALDGEGGVPDFRGLTLREAVALALDNGRMPQIEGWGRVVAQEPEPGTALAAAEKISLTLSPPTRESLMAEEPSLGLSQ